MIRLAVALTTLAVLSPVAAPAQPLVVTRGGTGAIAPGRASNFTGEVRVEMLSQPADPTQASAGSVTFAAGARTAWHSHPGGQTLIITAGAGRVQAWGEPSHDVRVGDVVTIPPDQKHWHGAAPRTALTHIAITTPRDGAAVRWMEQVSDEQYNGSATSSRVTERPSSASAPPRQQPPQSESPPQPASRPSGPVQQRIAPGLAALTDEVLFGDVWRRPELSTRDRSLVTVSVLIATGKPAQLAGHLGRALDNGVQPSEASALLAHLAMYCGWPSAVSALEVYDQVYTARKVDIASLRTVAPRLPASSSDAAQAARAGADLGTVAPKFVQLTNEVVFGDVWRRSDLSVRDRSLDDDQLDPYLRRAIEHGLTRAQIAEALTHLGFYAGWPKATKALSVVARLVHRR